MSRKVVSKGNLYFEYHNLTPEQKQKLTGLSEQFPEVAKDQIAAILSYYQFDSDETVNNLTLDGGMTALRGYKELQTSQLKQNSRSKRKNKKKTKKDDGSANSAASHVIDADDSSSLHSSNIDFDGEKEFTAKLSCDVTNDQVPNDSPSVSSTKTISNPTSKLTVTSSTVEIVSNSPVRTCKSGDTSDVSPKAADKEKDAVDPVNCDSPSANNEEKSAASVSSGTSRERNEEQHMRHSSQKVSYRQRHGSSHHSKSSLDDVSSGQAANPQKRGYIDRGSGFTKCKKDLHRQTVSLQRIQSQLETKLDEAARSMKNAFNDLKEKIQDRQNLLDAEFEKVRSDALSLLKGRQDLALDLKIRADRNSNDTEWNELRGDIKQFVTERKYDDELGKTIWFCWSPDEITEMISKFGAVCAVKNTYSQRHLPRTQPDSSEPSSPHSGDGDVLSATASTDAKTISNSDGNEVETKTEKDVPAKSAVQGSRVFSNSRSHYNHNQSGYKGNRFPSHPNRGRNNFPRNHGHSGNSVPGLTWQYDYKQQFHRSEYMPAHNKPGENGGENYSGHPRYGMGRENQGGPFRERRPYGMRHNRPYSNYGHSRGGGRPPRQHNDAGHGRNVDKNANYNSENKQSSEEMVNGYVE